VGDESILSYCFQNYLLVFCFLQFNCNVLLWMFFGLSYCNSLSILNVQINVFYLNLEAFCHYFFKYSFCLFLFFPFEIPIIHSCLLGCDTLGPFFAFYPVSEARSVLPIFKFTDNFFCPLRFAVEPI
jgi:hypothetical protein